MTCKNEDTSPRFLILLTLKLNLKIKKPTAVRKERQTNTVSI